MPQPTAAELVRLVTGVDPRANVACGPPIPLGVVESIRRAAAEAVRQYGPAVLDWVTEPILDQFRLDPVRPYPWDGDSPR